MLEALTNEALRDRLGYGGEVVAVGPVADMVRSAVGNWQSPARARVTSYLHRQLAAAGIEEERARERVRDVIDALIDIGDLTAVRIDGSQSLVRSRALAIGVGPKETALLGEGEGKAESWCYARSVAGPGQRETLAFADWLGPADFRAQLKRRSGGGSANGNLREFWSVLRSALHSDGQPIDPQSVRALTGPAGADNPYFGRHSLPAVEGRWSAAVAPGTWCAVRPGRNPSEWHPILVEAGDDGLRSLDLFDWDEWNWALLARGYAVGPVERSTFRDGLLAFEHPVPRQFVRALRLVGGPGGRPWTWRLSEAAFAAFENWRATES
jgi:hypothetical protein